MDEQSKKAKEFGELYNAGPVKMNADELKKAHELAGPVAIDLADIERKVLSQNYLKQEKQASGMTEAAFVEAFGHLDTSALDEMQRIRRSDRVPEPVMVVGRTIGLTDLDQRMSEIVKCKVEAGGQLPYKKRVTDAGFDLYATEEVILSPGFVTRIDTKVAVEIPPGYFGTITGRSSMNARGILTPTGTIDSEYRGTLVVLLHNLTPVFILIEKGHRIAQLVITKMSAMQIFQVDELSSTDRGTGGFGSTGK